MSEVREYPARSDWDDESPKDKTPPDEPAPKRQRTSAMHPPAATSRRIDPTVAKDILAFLDVHKVSDTMTVGSLITAFDETRQPLDALKLQATVRVGVLKVLLKVSAKGHPHAATPSNDASRQDLVTSQGQPAEAQSSKSEAVQPSHKRKRESSSHAKDSKPQPFAASLPAQGGVLNATRKHTATQATTKGSAIPKANPPPKNAGNKGKAAVPIIQGSNSRKRKCPEVDDEETLPSGAVKPYIWKDGTAPAPRNISKKAKLGHLSDVTGSRSNQQHPRAINEPKQPRAKEPENRYKLTSKPKPKPQASAPVQKAKGPEIKIKPATKSKPEPSATAHPVVTKTPSLRSQHIIDEVKKSKRKATEDVSKPAKMPKLDVSGKLSAPLPKPREPRAFEKPVKPKAKEPENRYRLSRAPKPVANLYARPATNIPPPRHNKRSATESVETEAEEAEERFKRQKTGTATSTRPNALARTKKPEIPQSRVVQEFDMSDFLRSNGVNRQYEVERPSLEEELAEQDRLTADRKKRERQERKKA